MPKSIDFKGYRLDVVYGCIDPDTAGAVMTLWQQTGVVSATEAIRRIPEVVCVLRNPLGEVAGVNTVYSALRLENHRVYFFYRTFIRSDSRGVRGLPTLMLTQAIEYLKAWSGRDGPVGIVIVTENPKLMRSNVVKRLAALGFTLQGKDRRGCDVWCLHFDGSPPPVFTED